MQSLEAHASSPDSTAADPSELSTLVAAVWAVLPESSEDEAQRRLCADVVSGSRLRSARLPLQKQTRILQWHGACLAPSPLTACPV